MPLLCEHRAAGGLMGGLEHEVLKQSQSLVSKKQLRNLLLFSSSLSSHTPLCCVYSLFIYTQSQTLTQPWVHVQNLTILVLLFPYLPCASFFLDVAISEIFQRQVSIWRCVRRLPTEGEYTMSKLFRVPATVNWHMQMAVSGAIYPQLLSLVGCGAHYQGLLRAPNCYTRNSNELMSGCGWLDVWSLQRLLPLWAGKRRLQKRSLCLRRGWECGGSKTAGSSHFLSLFHFHVLLRACHPRRYGEGAQNEVEWKSLKRIKLWSELKTRMTNERSCSTFWEMSLLGWLLSRGRLDDWLRGGMYSRPT